MARVEKDAETTEREFVIREKFIDKHNKRRTRVLVTPAVCRDCGFDAQSKLELDDKAFEELDAVVQAQLVKRLQAHRDEAHSPREAKVVKESKLAREWLGGAKKKTRESR